MRGKQISFLKPQLKMHGGAATSGNPRQRRPLSTKHPIHLVMRSSKARGAQSFRRRETAKRLEFIIERQAKRFGVKIYRFANAGNHLHFVVKITKAHLFANFLRVISGLIARLVLDAERGKSKLFGDRFWDARPFTRVVEWGKAFDILCDYLTLNSFEALGFIKHQKRDGRRRLWTVKFDPDPPKETSQARMI